MRKPWLAAVLCLIAFHGVCADEILRSVQDQLKNLGFYYGTADGNGGPETTAAVRRFQIRNGLKVTGTLTDETLAALRGAGGRRRPEPNDDRDLRAPAADYANKDRNFLEKRETVTRRDEAYPDEAVPPPTPLPPDFGGSGYAEFFRNSPFESAPVELQRDVLRSAQAELARSRYYRGEIDGVPGPETQRAILAFQDDEALDRTGRLDVDTLDQLDLLPRHRGRRFFFEFHSDWPPVRIYRGVRAE